MTYSVEFSYLQEYPQPVWRVVEKVESIREFKDHLQSPSFYPSIGCLCRLTDDHKHDALMLFCFDGENFIDIDDRSVIKQKTPWDMNGMNLIACWLGCEDPVEMLGMVHRNVDRRTLVKTACACARHGLIDQDGIDALHMIEIAEAWSRDEVSSHETTRYRIREGNRRMNDTDKIAYAALYTCEDSAHAVGTIQRAMRVIIDYYGGQSAHETMREYNPLMVDTIRDHVSCYDFVMSLVKP